MAYGEIKVDTITFTDGGIDKSVSISGLVQNPTFSGDITVTGTISGDTLQGQTVSGVTVTGTTAAFTSGTFIALTGTTTQGTTATYTTGSFTSLTGTTTQGTTATYTTGLFTSLTGTTISGTTAIYTTGTFTSLTGTTTTGVTSSFTTGTFTSLTGTTTTGTTANFASGVFTTQISGATVTGDAAAFTTVTGGTATITSGVFASGTAAAPSVSVGTTDNGIYSPGTDQVAISTNGAGRLSIDANGDVAVDTNTLYVDAVNNRVIVGGVGTTSPGAKLTVVESTANTSMLNLVGPNNYVHQFQNRDFGDHLRFYVNSAAPTWSWASSTFGEFARIDGSGRLLVGTSSSISTANGFTPSVQAAGTGAAAAISVGRYVNSTSAGRIVIQKSRNSTIGSHTIVQSGDDIGQISFEASDGSAFVQGATITAEVDGTPGANDMPGRLVFSTTADGVKYPTERMRIDSSGRLLFGGTDTTPATNNVSGIAFGGGGSVQISQQSFTVLFLNRGGGSPTGTVVDIKTGGTTVGTISVTASATAYNTSSDYRLKENITAVTDGITRLQQLKPSRFNFIVDPTKTVDGFLAHEVQTVVPEAITGEKDAVDDKGNPIYQGIDQSKLVPLLTAALQELVAEVESLKAEVAALKAQ